MKRLQQRTEYVARRAKQLRKKEDANARATEDRQEKYNFLFSRRKYMEGVKEAKQARREDWDLGPIAPRRHQTRDNQDDEAPYGTAHQTTIQGHARAFVPKSLTSGAVPYWTGQGRYATDRRMKDQGWQPLPVDKEARTLKWQSLSEKKKTEFKSLDNYLKPDYTKTGHHFMEGDRVVVIEGHEAGKISVVDKIKERNESVLLKDLNGVEVHLTKWMQQAEGGVSPIQTSKRAFHESQVRLVQPVNDPKTGQSQESVIDEMLLIRRWHPQSSSYSVQRFIPGTLAPIVNPKVQPRAPKDYSAEEAFDDDTLRITSEAVTFTPTLVLKVLPKDSVIDELRNKYSKKRTDHDDEFIEKLEEVDAMAEEKAKSYNKMQTPLMQANAKIGEQIKQYIDERKSQQGSLESVGEAIWKHLQKQKEAGTRQSNKSSDFGRALLVTEGVETATQRATL